MILPPLGLLLAYGIAWIGKGFIKEKRLNLKSSLSTYWKLLEQLLHLSLEFSFGITQKGTDDWTTTQKRTLQIVDCFFCVLGLLLAFWYALWRGNHKSICQLIRKDILDCICSSRHPSDFRQRNLLDTNEQRTLQIVDCFFCVLDCFLDYWIE